MMTEPRHKPEKPTPKIEDLKREPTEAKELSAEEAGAVRGGRKKFEDFVRDNDVT